MSSARSARPNRASVHWVVARVRPAPLPAFPHRNDTNWRRPDTRPDTSGNVSCHLRSYTFPSVAGVVESDRLRAMGSRLIWTAMLAAALAGCKDKKQATTPKNTATDTKIDNSLCEADGKRVVKFDLNKDGKDDVWRLYAGTVMTCKQDDFDHDGRKDWLA